MAVELTVVREVVLCSRNCLEILRVAAHKAAYETAGNLCGKERILTVRLARTSPAGVADRLYDRAPEGQAFCAGCIDSAGLVSDG